MANNRLTTEETERDEFAESLQKFIEFVQKNYLALIGLLVLVVVVILWISSSQERQARLDTQVNVALTNNLARFNEIEATSDETQRRDQTSKLLTSLDDMIKQNPNHPLALQAYFLKGRVYYTTDQFEKAQEAYRTFIDKASNAEDRARGEIALGYAFENQSFLVGDAKKQRELLTSAMSSYVSAGKRLPESYLFYYALMAQARVHDLLGDKDEAIKLYQQVILHRKTPNTVASGAKTKKANLDTNDPMNYMRDTIQQMESQLGFKETARLRLANLKGDELKTPAAEAEKPAAAAKP